MAKTEIKLRRGVRMPATRTEGGKVVTAGEVITDASELDGATLKAMAAKGYVAGMEPEGDAEEADAPKKSAKKGK